MTTSSTIDRASPTPDLGSHLATTTATEATFLQRLAIEADRLAALEADLTKREAAMAECEANVAEAYERLTLANRETAIWREATAARDRHWATLIALQLQQLSPQSSTATMLRHLERLATGQDLVQMEG